MNAGKCLVCNDKVEVSPGSVKRGGVIRIRRSLRHKEPIGFLCLGCCSPNIINTLKDCHYELVGFVNSKQGTSARLYRISKTGKTKRLVKELCFRPDVSFLDGVMSTLVWI